MLIYNLRNLVHTFWQPFTKNPFFFYDEILAISRVVPPTFFLFWCSCQNYTFLAIEEKNGCLRGDGTLKSSFPQNAISKLNSRNLVHTFCQQSTENPVFISNENIILLLLWLFLQRSHYCFMIKYWRNHVYSSRLSCFWYLCQNYFKSLAIEESKNRVFEEAEKLQFFKLNLRKSVHTFCQHFTENPLFIANKI